MSEFPQDFVQYVKNDPHLGEGLLNALNTASPTSIRKNKLKNTCFFENEVAIPWCDEAFFLKERPNYTLNPLFHAGTFYPQEAGSMLLHHVLTSLELTSAPKILDLCAAPGGKSTLIASFLNEEGILVSNEVINQRAKVLKENSSKWGYANVIVTNNDPSDFSKTPSFFDVVVVDAPCSGEGMFRKDLNARDEWSLENVNLCSARQKRIVADVWDSLAEGGFLIYSTCTFNENENEKNISWIAENLGAELVSITVPPSFKKGREGIGIYGIPGLSETEGFYIAVLRKTKSQPQSISFKKNTSKGLQKLNDLSPLSTWVKMEQLSFYTWNNRILAIPTQFENDFLLLQNKLHIVKWGVTIGEIARKGLIPDHDLIMCPSLRLNYPSIELEEQLALYYLHGDTFTLPQNIANGFAQVTFQSEPLGWIKNIGNRFNNLYPKEYRIRMDIPKSH